MFSGLEIYGLLENKVQKALEIICDALRDFVPFVHFFFFNITFFSFNNFYNNR